MKFKVGDKVRIVRVWNNGSIPPNTIEMCEKEIGKLTKITYCGSGDYPYSVKDSINFWSEKELELIDETSPQKLIIKCSSEQEFNDVQRKVFKDGGRWGFGQTTVQNYWSDNNPQWIELVNNTMSRGKSVEYIEERYPSYTFLTAKEFLGECPSCGEVVTLAADYVYSLFTISNPYYHSTFASTVEDNKPKTIMQNILQTAKNLLLTADEKLLRKYGLKDECGNYTSAAREIVIDEMCKANEAKLLEVAKAQQAEEK